MLWLMLVLCQQPTFIDVSVAAGASITHEYNKNSSLENTFIAAGVAAEDFDGDGWIDLFIARGDGQDAVLLRNQGDGTFADIAPAMGLRLSDRFNCGPTVADYDGDGDLDLFIGGVNGTRAALMRNDGGVFTDVTAAAGLVTDGDTYGFALADVDRDGDLDLFSTHWQTGDEGDFFWRNLGDGAFRNEALTAGFADSFRPDYTFTPNFADIDNDRWPDLLLASDRGTSQVFRNNQRGNFIDVTTAVISDENGMGAAVGDYDNDGDLDWFVSAISPITGKRALSGNRLYQNQGDGSFVDVTDEAGVREGYWGWAASFADFNNDGWLDIYHVNGFLGNFANDYNQDLARFFIARGDGSFDEVSESVGLADTDQGRGLVCLDFDLDGDLDIFTSNNQQPTRLYRNDGQDLGAWLRVRLRQPGPNTRGVGARVYATTGDMTQMREIAVSNNFVSQNPIAAHFGFGTAATVDLRIHWPNGLISTHAGVDVNQSIEIEPPLTARNGDAARRIAHITRDGGGFATQLRLTNTDAAAATADIQAFAADGSLLGQATRQLDANRRELLNLSDLFPDQAVSHLSVYAPQTLQLTAEYRAAVADAAPATVHATNHLATQFDYYPGAPAVVFDGLALVNHGDAPATVRAQGIDDSGDVVQEITLIAELAVGAKHLATFDTLFPTQDQQAVRILVDQPSQAILLRGTRPGVTPAVLFTVEPLPRPEIDTNQEPLKSR